ncbi:hypothetical protein [Natronoglycomyces albus]|uniref:(2Fe-2S)-binding protein n=1 Tax=Natronoglycomyces albus TaxID=2811108 RepID=A0A895XJ71_9ACTN|nr:hypothetical protein [Natronoglycomyces albus]QSB05027.1 (2Fe-2S)-binding protein [Natronoglycomyces albus]
MTLISSLAVSSTPTHPGELPHRSSDASGDMRAPMREAAYYLENHVGPHPLAGIKPWLEHGDVPQGTIVNSGDLAAGGEVTAALIEHSSQLWGAADHVSVALAWKTYCYWSVLPSVLGFVSAHRVPLWNPEEAHFVIGRESPLFSLHLGDPKFAVLADDPLASHPAAVVMKDHQELLDAMRATLFDGHLEVVMSALRQQARIGRRNLLGSLASGICYAVACCAEASHVSSEAIAAELLEAFDVAHLVDISSDEFGKLTYRRHTCCLAFTLEGRNVCSTCCLPEAGQSACG